MPGYTLTGITCVTSVDATPRELASITLAVGESGVCTYVNNDEAPRLTLKKQVRDLDGNLTFSADWTLLAGGSDSTTPINGSSAVAEDGISALVTAGVTYTLGESAARRATPTAPPGPVPVAAPSPARTRSCWRPGPTSPAPSSTR